MTVTTSVAWRNLTLGTAPGDSIVSIEGWEELPTARYDNVQRARAHGSHPSPVWSDQRLVTVTGTSYSPTQRDALLQTLQSGMGFGDGGEEPLTVTLAGRTLTASGQLLRCSPAVAAGTWNINLLGWVAQWRCTDPFRYGPPQSATTGLPTAGGGLAYPLAYPLDYGAAGASGQITLTNPGTAAAGIVFTVTGPLLGGFEVSAAGGRITYPTPVPAGQTITIDTAAGTVLAEGTADRRGELTNADWLLIPKASDGGSLTVQFTSLGGYDPAAQLTATWKATYW